MTSFAEPAAATTRLECPALQLRAGQWWLEDVRLEDVANEFGTPSYVYSRAQLRANHAAFAKAIGDRDVMVCYAVKANSNLAVIAEFAKLGAGFDIVSAGELARVIAAGGRPDRIVFSGVGKSADELRAALVAGVGCFNVESEPELRRLSDIAQTLGCRAPVSLRVNPNIDAKTHPYISTGLLENKFGVAWDATIETYKLASQLPGIDVIGVDCHIGSQITELSPFLEALDRLLGLVAELQALGIPIRHLDLGGGLGITYSDEEPPSPQTLLEAIFARVDAAFENRPPKLLFEMGRALVGNAGLLLTRVEYLKRSSQKNFLIVDAAMNDLIRPALYQAWHSVIEVQPSDREVLTVDVVGPVCESGDWLAKNRRLAATEGSLLAILSAGAYGFVQASNYNSRALPPELMIDGDRVHLLRPRQSLESLFATEKLID